MAVINAGTISVDANGTTVTGVDSNWALTVRAGDELVVGAIRADIASVTSDTEIILESGWPSTALTGSGYYIAARRGHDSAVTNQRLADLVTKIEAGSLFHFDANGTLDQRADFDNEAQGFSYLQTDVDPMLVFVKQSATSADWSTGVEFLKAGSDGAKGAPGQNGAAVNYSENGVPASSLGVDGETAVNIVNGVTYEKTGGAWVVAGNIRGPRGVRGPAGEDGTDGRDGFDGEIGVKGADLVSAAELPVNDLADFFDVTGTTTITSLAAVRVGKRITLQFDETLTLTHHATDLVLPGRSDITTAPGDVAAFVEYAGGNWWCVSYTRASGEAVVGASFGTVAEDILPDADSTRDLGSASKAFAEANINTVKATTISGPSGTDPAMFTKQIAPKGYVSYNQHAAYLAESFGVSSVTDNATGDLTVNLSSNMNTIFYAIVDGSANRLVNTNFGNNIGYGTAPTTSAIRTAHFENGVLTDTLALYQAYIGDLA